MEEVCRRSTGKGEGQLTETPSSTGQGPAAVMPSPESKASSLAPGQAGKEVLDRRCLWVSSPELTMYQGDCTVDLLETFPASPSPPREAVLHFGFSCFIFFTVSGISDMLGLPRWLRG